VDELQNHAHLAVIVIGRSESTAREYAECRANAFARGITNVGNVGLDHGIEGTHLLADGYLDQFQVRSDKFKGEGITATLMLCNGWHIVEDLVKCFTKSATKQAGGESIYRHGLPSDWDGFLPSFSLATEGLWFFLVGAESLLLTLLETLL
jgi:hypothetical protein